MPYKSKLKWLIKLYKRNFIAERKKDTSFDDLSNLLCIYCPREFYDYMRSKLKHNYKYITTNEDFEELKEIYDDLVYCIDDINARYEICKDLYGLEFSTLKTLVF